VILPQGADPPGDHLADHGLGLVDPVGHGERRAHRVQRGDGLGVILPLNPGPDGQRLAERVERLVEILDLTVQAPQGPEFVGVRRVVLAVERAEQLRRLAEEGLGALIAIRPVVDAPQLVEDVGVVDRAGKLERLEDRLGLQQQRLGPRVFLGPPVVHRQVLEPGHVAGIAPPGQALLDFQGAPQDRLGARGVPGLGTGATERRRQGDVGATPGAQQPLLDRQGLGQRPEGLGGLLLLGEPIAAPRELSGTDDLRPPVPGQRQDGIEPGEVELEVDGLPVITADDRGHPLDDLDEIAPGRLESAPVGVALPAAAQQLDQALPGLLGEAMVGSQLPQALLVGPPLDGDRPIEVADLLEVAREVLAAQAEVGLPGAFEGRLGPRRQVVGGRRDGAFQRLGRLGQQLEGQERLRMLRAQGSAADRQRLGQERLGLRVSPLGLEELRQVHGPLRVGRPLVGLATAEALERFAEGPFGFVQLAPSPLEHAEIAPDHTRGDALLAVPVLVDPQRPAEERLGLPYSPRDWRRIAR
jgi:hypothetical protein